jgi:hypothetical protein
MGTVAIAAYRALGTFPVEISESLKGDKSGALVAVERTGKYPRFAMQYLLDSVDLPRPIHVTYGITLYRVQYRTRNYDGSVVVASGLVALPNRSDLNSVVIYHHGTTGQRHAAPSQPGLGEGVLIAAATSGMGHVLVAPDYIGLGESRVTHPYMYVREDARIRMPTTSHQPLRPYPGSRPSTLDSRPRTLDILHRSRYP